MSERAASVFGFLFSIFVVFLVMNIHVVEDIFYDIKGVVRPSNQPRHDIGGHGGSDIDLSPFISSKQPGAFTGSSGGATAPPAGRPVAFGSSSPAPSGQGTKAQYIKGEQVGSPDKAASFLDVPQDEANEFSPVLFLLCTKSSADASLWLVGLSPEAHPFKVNAQLPEYLSALFSSLKNQPAKIGFSFYGCSSKQLKNATDIFINFCEDHAFATSFFDIPTGKILPGCGY